MSNIEKFLQSQQGLAQAHSNLQSQFNQNYNLERQIYAAKQQALGSAKALVGQQIGQERLETILGTAPLAKKVGTSVARAVANPERAAQEVREGVANVGTRIQQRAQAVADRFRGTLDDAQERFSRVRDDVEDARDAAERVTEPLRQAPEPGDIEFSAERGFTTPFARPFEGVRPGLRPVPERDESALPSDFFEFKAPTRAETLAKVAEENRVQRLRDIDPTEVRPPENVQSQIKDLSGHSLRPTETREADPLQDIDPEEIGLQLPKVEGVAEQAITSIPVSQARALRFTEADFPAPPRELRNVPRQAEPTGSYQRPGTQYKVQSNRTNPDESAEPEPNPIQAEPVRQAQAVEPEPEPEPTSAEELSGRLSDIRSGIEQSTQEALREQPTSSDDVFERFRQAAQQRIRDAPDPQPSRPLPGERPEDFPDVPQTSGGEEQRSEGGIDKQLEDRLDNLRGEPSAESTLAEGGDAERTAAFVGREAATTAAETGGELAAEAPLLEIPGLGEIAMAATLIGSLVKGEKEAKQETEATPGPAPTPQKAPTPYINFDAAPTLDTSSYHQN